MVTKTYYARKLCGERLDRVYAIAGPRVRQYLQAEIDHVRALIRPGDRVLELGCGTGRVLGALQTTEATFWGVDNAPASIRLAGERYPGCRWAVMDAAALGLRDGAFDLAIGVQNFISACQVPPEHLVRECLRVVRPGGRVLFSSYAEPFWFHRLEWFRAQAAEGLLGAIDEAATGDGVIVGRDGFRAVTFRPEDFAALARQLGVTGKVCEVDGSSLFFEVTRPTSAIPARLP